MWKTKNESGAWCFWIFRHLSFFWFVLFNREFSFFVWFCKFLFAFFGWDHEDLKFMYENFYRSFVFSKILNANNEFWFAVFESWVYMCWDYEGNFLYGTFRWSSSCCHFSKMLKKIFARIGGMPIVTSDANATMKRTRSWARKSTAKGGWQWQKKESAFAITILLWQHK